MTSKIHFQYKGKEYFLEYTRNSIKEMEKKGFKVAEVMDKPMSLLPEMFAGAFIANHRFTSRKLIDEIFSKFDDKGELLNELAEMYSLVIEDFVNELEKSKNGLAWERK